MRRVKVLLPFSGSSGMSHCTAAGGGGRVIEAQRHRKRFAAAAIHGMEKKRLLNGKQNERNILLFSITKWERYIALEYHRMEEIYYCSGQQFEESFYCSLPNNVRNNLQHRIDGIS